MIEIQTLLHPTDGSDAAAPARALAEALADRFDADLHTLRVDVAPTASAEAEDEVSVTPLGDDRQRVEVTQRLPSVGDAIAQYAADAAADLIVMGTHGRSGFNRIVMGSTAEYVLRRSPCPVLTVRPDAAPFGDGPVLCALEFEDADDGVLEAAAGLAHALGVRLVVFHAVEPIVLPAPYAVEMGVLGLDELVRGAREALAERLAARPDLPVAAESLAEAGMAVPLIVETAERIGAGVVVQGSHGRRGLGRALLGSVAEAVARRAPCPVLTLRRGARPLAVSERDALTGARPISRDDWSSTIDALSLYAERDPWTVSVSVVGGGADGDVFASARLRGLTYDPHDDALCVMVDGAEHSVRQPLALRLLRDGGGEPFTLEVVRRDGARERISAGPAATGAG